LEVSRFKGIEEIVGGEALVASLIEFHRE